MSLVPGIARSQQLLQGVRGLSSAGRQYVLAGSIEDKGRSEENVKFREEDERLLRQLREKIKAKAGEGSGGEHTKSVDLGVLKEILGKYNVAEADLEKVLVWKHR